MRATVGSHTCASCARTHPDWYYNLRANPKTQIEIGTETVDATATIAEGEEHDRIWMRQRETMPGFAEYERNTERKLPVIVLARA